ncbi:erythrocyte membrane protein 1, EMP1 [Plasmodium reichenowi]|uniref:Erythrocyte membrane protein 1, EMP1 n=1 Tax=Plasmodium reichenowi TaxID=5854 RepID=A0A060RR78_PLARE|nr:erythrocyte membrane protein 1, EMP1 [Plasmodium reichenowi]
MAPGHPHRGGKEEDASVKHLFHRIGGIIQEQAHNAAHEFRNKLHGNLSHATYRGTRTGVTSACELDHKFETSGTTGHSNPCEGRQPVRFSDTKGAYCYRKGIKGNDEGTGGACAPFRRLHLCDKNLEQIEPHQVTTTDNLLADVCLAALHEGQSLVEKYKEYKAQNHDFDTDICTVLERSFADIGDIIRGKDLFLGYKQGKKQLEDKLIKIFEKIYKDLTNNEIKDVTKRNAAKKHYEDDEKDGKFFKLREDWWDANRNEVWKAITCKAEEGDKYNVIGSDGNITPSARGHCKGIADVPTNLDYVPQYLRWFEEWGEEFCRKRKKKLENAIKNCRQKEDKNKYCDLNGYDCEKTARGQNKFFPDSDCNKCSVACKPFVKWIDDKKQEFLKQKVKYENAIKEDGTIITTSNGTINNLYVKDFYDILKEQYGKVENFLGLLSKEEICKEHPEVGEKKKTSINFNENSEDIFSHTEYCQACPWCGVDCRNGGNCTKKQDNSCQEQIPEKKYDHTNTTEIPILTPDTTKTNILRKYNNFCSDSKIKNDEWKCHYEHTDQSNICVLQDENVNTKKQKDMSYNVFFYRSIIDMLIDSIEWREKHDKCLKKDNNQCVKSCNRNCACYKKWIDKKKEEFEKIREHFRKQGDMLQDKKHLTDPDTTLKFILDVSFLEDIEKAYEDQKQVEKIKKRLEKKMDKDFDSSRTNTSIDDFLQEEEQFSIECKKCQEPQDTGVGRSLPPRGNDIHDDDDEKPKQKDSRINPCSGETGKKEYPVVAQKVAQKLHEETQKQLDGNTRSVLKADAKQGTYTRGGIGSKLTDACSITDKHTNDNRSNNDYKGPCTGKGDGFKIGDIWKTNGELQIKDPYLFLPPRRQHFCTSNLEKIHVGSTGLKGANAIHSLLGDVLLSANKQAEWIKVKYKQNEGKEDLNDPHDQATVCRAMKYSFADIGDIIKGTDLWDKKREEQKTQENLVTIFGKIKGELEDKLNGIYDKDTNPNHKQLRSDWWEVNREKVWDAMKCHISELKDTSVDPSSKGHCGYSEHPPYDDYIPQRLRWMTEWAEWYCKEQYKLYEELEDACTTCKNSGQRCTKDSGNGECAKCTTACTTYKNKIKEWANQWTKMQIQYAQLYGQAKTASASTFFGGTGPDYKQVVDFLRKLKKQYEEAARSSSVITESPYESAPGYIHQEAHITECDTQREFCEKKNDSAGITTNEKYALTLEPHEYKGACNCMKNVVSRQEERARSERGEDQPLVPPRRPEPSGPVEPPKVEVDHNVCETVKKALEDNTALQKACDIKYNKGKNYGWRCIPTNTTNTSEATGPSVDKSGEKGAICIPPRRRRLYIGRLTQWAATVNGTTSETSQDSKELPNGDGAGSDQTASESSVPTAPQSGGPSTSEGSAQTALQREAELLKAFVESAAVETFFLWDRYKKIKAKEDIENQTANETVTDKSDAGKKLQETLEKGDIPDEFKRQMFYTLGDYRDICMGKAPNGIDEVITSVGSDKDTSHIKIKDISDKIKQTLEKPNGDTSRGPSSSSHSGQPSSRSVKDPSSWWEENGPHIWRGMVCALTYDTNIQSGEKPARLEAVYNKFFGNKNPLNTNNVPGALTPPDTITGTYKDNYDYTTVAIDAKETEAILTGDSNINAASGTKLKDFVKRPPYFRWLEEWADEFCRKQKHKLYIIEKDCRGKNGEKECSGDGFNCDDESPKKEGIFETFLCPSCGKHCRFYKKWIERKKDEYEKQQKAYEQQKKDAEGNNNDYKEFSAKLKTWPNAVSFLEKLKDGPCKNNTDSVKDKTGNSHITFDESSDTFQHTEHCGPCSVFGVNCNNGSCRNGGNTKVECNKGKINAKDIVTMENSTVLEMRVSDNTESGKEFDDLKECKDAGIFTGIRKDEWKCGYVCGVDLCKAEKAKGQKGNGENTIIQIRVLFKRWLEYFLQDYNRIRKKINQCVNNKTSTSCIKGCYKNCDCVEKWIGKKREEWEKINSNYLKQYIPEDNNDGNNLKSFLEQAPFHNEVQNAIKPCDDLTKFESFCGLNSHESSEKKVNKEDTPKDLVECLLQKLEKKIKECTSLPRDESQPTCVNSSLSGKESPLVEDVDEEEENEEENQVEHPQICKGVIQPEKEKEVETCDTAVTPSETKDSSGTEDTTGENVDGKPKAEEDTESPPAGPEAATEDSEDSNKDTKEPAESQPKEKQPVPAPTPAESQPEEQLPPQLDQPTNSISDILSSTIPFGIAIALTSIAFLFLKVTNKYMCGICVCFVCGYMCFCGFGKKTKSSVDMLRVLQIPQNDYGMPTKLSSNRYIPYKSAQYRGKRYIYLEGDSSGDEKYAFMSDTTDVTSSESEYEEFDINDIYVPGSPKYKTLIEVVLEPSHSGDHTPSDNTPSNKFTDNEWNQLKDEFISNMLQNEQNDVPNDYTSGNSPTNTNNTTPSHDIVDNNTHPTMSHDIVDNNTHPTMSHDNVDNNIHPTTSHDNMDEKPFVMSIHDRNLLNTDNMDEKPFVMSIHDRNLLNGEEYSYDMSNNIGNNDLYSDIYPTSDNHHPYSGIDLINDTLSGGNHDIYDEILKRKENELFGTEHPKHTTTNRVATKICDDPITNQLELFHKWLDRHRNMCDQWDTNNKKEEFLDKLKEEWNKDNNNSGNKNSNIPSNIPNSDIQTSDIHSGKLSDMHSGKLSDILSDNNIHSDIPHVLNSDVSIQIDMDDPKPINALTNMDTIIDNLEKYSEPY